jgi:hypothetical protein
MGYYVHHTESTGAVGDADWPRRLRRCGRHFVDTGRSFTWIESVLRMKCQVRSELSKEESIIYYKKTAQGGEKYIHVRYV